MTWPARRRLYERVARRFYASVYRYVNWLCGDGDMGRDLTQETFVQVWAHLHELRREQSVKAWLFRVARNEYLQHLRHSRLQTIALEDCTEAQEIDATTPGPGVALERALLCEAVRCAVQRLPALYREVVVLHNMEDLSLGHVAEVLGIPIGTVKSRRAKAFALLRRMLAAEVRSDDMQSSSRESAR